MKVIVAYHDDGPPEQVAYLTVDVDGDDISDAQALDFATHLQDSLWVTAKMAESETRPITAVVIQNIQRNVELD